MGKVQDVERTHYAPGEVAEMTSLNRMTVLRAIHREELRAIRIGRRYVIPKEAIAEWLAACNEQGGEHDSAA
jgi:excisionase family DNA binding protein